jgi:hypothetical protein
MSYADFKAEVDKIFREQVGSGWVDLCGDEGPLQKAYAEEESPRDFVLWWINKFDLTTTDEVML